MIALPKELAPWGSLLGLFPPELAGDLGRMLPRVALAIGPMRAARPIGGGEPEGFSGIARRGSYERLLLTEWLLADEAPDEFARRAAMGEHAFFQVARRSPARAASSVAIFDAGPAQIGGPRIAQLAALVVLAARAEKAGARFAWGVLGDPEGALLQAVTAQSVLSLLHARTGLAASDDDVAAWADRAARSGWEDAWIVGSAPSIARWRFATLEIRDVLDPDRRALAVMARSPNAAPRSVELDLPEPRVSVKLLRDPFAAAPAHAPRKQKRTHAPASNLVFAMNGAKLFARAENGDILSFPIPNSPRDAIGRPKRYRARTPGVVAAVGWVARGLGMIVVTPTEIVVEHTGHRGPRILLGAVKQGRDRAAISHAADPLSELVFRDQGGHEVLFTDARSALFRLRARRDAEGPAIGNVGATVIERVALEVSALSHSPTRLAFVGREQATQGDAIPRDTQARLAGNVQTIPPGALPALGSGWQLVVSRNVPAGFKLALAGDGTYETFFGGGFVAIQDRGDAWTMMDEQTAAYSELKPPSGTRVVGVWRHGPGTNPELLVTEADQRTISFVGRNTSRSLPRAGATIVDLAANVLRGLIAYRTTEGEVVVHALVHDTPLARFTIED